MSITSDILRGHTETIILSLLLEQAGCIRTYWGDETTGARRRYYSITEKGRETYASNRRDWEEAKELIDRLLDDDGEGTA